MSSPARVLIVDDDAEVRAAVVRMLRPANYELVEAADGTEALALARSSLPDLVLLDVVLPDLDGAEVCRQLKADPALGHALVVNLSANRATMDDKVQGLSGGADGYLTWPIKSAELRAHVQAYLRIARAEEALRASAERHRTILETAMDGFWVADAEGRILEVNDTYCRMSGYSQQELLAMQIAEVEADAGSAERVEQIMAHGDARFESRHRRKDGSLFDVAASIQYRPDHGGCLVGFFHDITDRRRAAAERAKLESQLLQSQKLESVGRLAGGVAHDFNNKLGVILGQVELAMEQIGPAEPIRQELLEIRSAAQHSADLTRQLLTFARKQTIAPVVHDLNETVVGLHGRLQQVLGKNIQLNLLLGANLWPVEADSGQLGQILIELCANARDAVIAGGTVVIETSNAPLDDSLYDRRPSVVAGDYVRLAVRDDGCGMDGTTLACAFEPFFTTKDIGEGPGLGLATVHGAVQQNHGFIDVQSEPGQGTTVAICLPRHVGGEASTPAEDPVAKVEPCRGTILLAEDEPALLRLTTRMLQRQGYRVLPAGSSGAALHLARQHPGELDLLVTDILMPEGNGLDLARQVTLLHPQIKRLFMSGHTADVIATHGVLEPGVHFLAKPFSGLELRMKVASLLGSG